MGVRCQGVGEDEDLLLVMRTYVFDEQVAWLATQCSKSAVTELMQIAWRTVGAIITRVWADTEAVHDRFAGLLMLSRCRRTSCRRKRST